MKPRCILFVGKRRCPRAAAKGAMGDLFCCTQHTLFKVALMGDRLPPTTRQMLAFNRWETRAEGQELIYRMFGRRVA